MTTSLPDVERYTTPTSRTTGISAQAIAAGANYLGAEIDFSSELDTLCDITVTHDCAVAVTAGDYLEVYMLLETDGSNYEDGDATPVDPLLSPVGIVQLFADTDTHYTTLRRIPIYQWPTKLLIKSEGDQSVTVTVTLHSYAKQQADT